MSVQQLANRLRGRDPMQRLAAAVELEAIARQERNDAIRAAYESGTPVAALADATGLSRQAVYNVLRSA